MKQRNAFELILWSSCLAMFAVGANSTAIMAALPSMTTELSLSSAGVEWAVNSYLVVSASFIVLGGQAADRFGARPVSLAGLALFAVGSCRIATSGTEAALLTGRALQGFAAAFAVPSTLAGVNAGAIAEPGGYASAMRPTVFAINTPERRLAGPVGRTQDRCCRGQIRPSLPVRPVRIWVKVKNRTMPAEGRELARGLPLALPAHGS